MTGPVGMHKDLILKFIENETLIMSPIIPHYAEHVWGLLGNSTRCPKPQKNPKSQRRTLKLRDERPAVSNPKPRFLNPITYPKKTQFPNPQTT